MAHAAPNVSSAARDAAANCGPNGAEGREGILSCVSNILCWVRRGSAIRCMRYSQKRRSRLSAADAEIDGKLMRLPCGGWGFMRVFGLKLTFYLRLCLRSRVSNETEKLTKSDVEFSRFVDQARSRGQAAVGRRLAGVRGLGLWPCGRRIAMDLAWLSKIPRSNEALIGCLR
jgi:hypothetical protein